MPLLLAFSAKNHVVVSYCLHTLIAVIYVVEVGTVSLSKLAISTVIEDRVRASSNAIIHDDCDIHLNNSIN
jgi:hypothetical protein